MKYIPSFRHIESCLRLGMMMVEHEGILETIGPAKVDHIFTVYSYIKIGDTVIKSAAAADGLANVLKGQIGKNVELRVIKQFGKKLIIGLTQEDGQSFRQGTTRQFISMIFAIAFGLMFFVPGLLGLMSGSPLGWTGLIFGIPLLWMGYRCLRLFAQIRSMPADHVF